METSECLCDWDTYIAVAFQHYGHGWGFPEQGLRQISMANCGFDAERMPHYHTQICYVSDAGQRSVAEKGRVVRMMRKQEMIFFHENALGAATQECATRALRERNPRRHLVSGRHHFVISACELSALICPTRRVNVSLVGPKPTSGARIVALTYL